MDYKKIYTQAFALENTKKSKDELHWSHFKFPKTIEDYYPVEYIDVCQTSPYPVAITAGSKVLMCDTETSPPDHEIHRFHTKAYGAKFRADGKLLVVGSEQSEVKLFDCRKKTLLRSFEGHTCAVHRVDFVSEKPEIASFSDDKSVGIWDIATEQIKETFLGHTSMIRAGVASPTSGNIVISGSYDRTVKMWDSRMQSCAMSFSHMSSVNAVLAFPNGLRIAAADLSEVIIHDLVAGKVLKKFSNHHKSITSLTYVSISNTLMSGSLDRHVNIYNMDKMKYIHTLTDYSSPILSLGVTDTASTLVVGMSAGDKGLISFQHEDKEKRESILAEELNKHIISMNKKKKNGVKVATEKGFHLSKPEDYLRKFDYIKCLISLSQMDGSSEHVVGILQKLLQIDVLKRVLPLSDDKVISFIEEFVIKYIAEPTYTTIIEAVACTLIDFCDEQLCRSFTRRLENTLDSIITMLRTEFLDIIPTGQHILSHVIVEQNRDMEAVRIKEYPQTTTKTPVKRKAIFDISE